MFYRLFCVIFLFLSQPIPAFSLYLSIIIIIIIFIIIIIIYEK